MVWIIHKTTNYSFRAEQILFLIFPSKMYTNYFRQIIWQVGTQALPQLHLSSHETRKRNQEWKVHWHKTRLSLNKNKVVHPICSEQKWKISCWCFSIMCQVVCFNVGTVFCIIFNIMQSLNFKSFFSYSWDSWLSWCWVSWFT